MSQTPTVNDNTFSLWLKIAHNLYLRALEEGAVGLNPPSVNDNELNLKKKAAYYSARIADAS